MPAYDHDSPFYLRDAVDLAAAALGAGLALGLAPPADDVSVPAAGHGRRAGDVEADGALHRVPQVLHQGHQLAVGLAQATLQRVDDPLGAS